MQHALLRVDVHAEVAQKIEAEKPGHLGIGHRVVNHRGEVFHFHAADVDRLQARQRRLDHAIGGLKDWRDWRQTSFY